MLLPISLTTIAACAVLDLWHALRISLARRRGNVMMGDGDDPRLFALQRAHANFTEYAPFVVLLIAGIELAGGSAPWLWAAGGLFVVARIAHALGMPRPAPNALRAGGIMATWTILAALAVWAVVIAATGRPQAAAIAISANASQG